MSLQQKPCFDEVEVRRDASSIMKLKIQGREAAALLTTVSFCQDRSKCFGSIEQEEGRWGIQENKAPSLSSVSLLGREHKGEWNLGTGEKGR